ncbi:MAG: signal peptidase I [Gammaproteobacteria bacterium]|nr:signal peptidase I [Gammaproteobacteria bacterium]MCP5424368.1 signal peptidase I [Gammaproteobacteria bacterium]
MNFDFATVLVLLALVTGVIWLLDIWVLAPKRALSKESSASNKPFPDHGKPRSGELTLDEAYGVLGLSPNASDKALRKAYQRLISQHLPNSGSSEATANRPDGAPIQQVQTAFERINAERKLPWYVDLSRSFFPIIVAVLVLRSFIVEPFRIPSGSMEPTLLPGDFILVNKFAYGLRLPVVNAKILDTGSPQRGDVVVFRYPEDPSIAYIKRIIGLPGDHLQYRDKQLYINGVPATQSDVAEAMGPGGFEQRMEQLGDVQHAIQINSNWALTSLWQGLDLQRDFAGRLISWEYDVPPGHYFALGDNRDNSRDSRFWGPLPEQNLIGKAFLIWMNWDCVTFNGHCGRIGEVIR